MNPQISSKALIADSKENRDLFQHNDKCDKYDYLIAAGCGAIGGLIDVFLVGAPGDSKLGNWTDAQVDKCVKIFAKLNGWNGKNDKVASAIGFLERKFRVNYDQRYTSDTGGLVDMSAGTHHLKSLAHSPDIIGLFFSILNQFTSTSTFISNGKIITIDTETFELQGNNFLSKLFCGVANWLGHLMSDIAGSSGRRGHGKRGSGINMPFYELFGLCNFGSLGKDKQTVAQLSEQVFIKGYDARFGLAMAIPVLITDLSIRLVWSLRRHFQYNRPIRECIPTASHPDLRVMLIVGYGTLCLIDGVDAAIRSGGDVLAFVMRLNLIAWGKLLMMVLKEIFLRIKLPVSIQQVINAYKRINEALLTYLHELEKIDIDAFHRETKEYSALVAALDKAETPQQLNTCLLDIYDRLKMEKPWQGDFDTFMADRNGPPLVFG